MSRIIERACEVFGLDTPAANKKWAAYEQRLHDTVGAYGELFQKLLTEETERMRKVTPPRYPEYSLRIVAEERLRLRALCTARCALPAAGVEAPELQAMGFVLPRAQRRFGPLQIVDFPEAWHMEPVRPEPDLLDSAHARVLDENDSPQLSVFYRDSVAGDSLRAHMRLIESAE